MKVLIDIAYQHTPRRAKKAILEISDTYYGTPVHLLMYIGQQHCRGGRAFDNHADVPNDLEACAKKKPLVINDKHGNPIDLGQQNIIKQRGSTRGACLKVASPTTTSRVTQLGHYLSLRTIRLEETQSLTCCQETLGREKVTKWLVAGTRDNIHTYI
jgi:hypothetical protein